MLENWRFIGLFLLIAPTFPILPLAVNWLLGPKKPNTLKNQTYECGVEAIGSSWIQFRMQYYIFAIIFVVFDVEVLFLFPIAKAYDQLTVFAIIEVVVFILILTGGLLYDWGKGALEYR